MSGHALRHAVNTTSDPVSGGGGVGSTGTLKYPGGPAFVWEVTAQDDHKVAWK